MNYQAIETATGAALAYQRPGGDWMAVEEFQTYAAAAAQAKARNDRAAMDALVRRAPVPDAHNLRRIMRGIYGPSHGDLSD